MKARCYTITTNELSINAVLQLRDDISWPSKVQSARCTPSRLEETWWNVSKEPKLKFSNVYGVIYHRKAGRCRSHSSLVGVTFSQVTCSDWSRVASRRWPAKVVIIRRLWSTFKWPCGRWEIASSIVFSRFSQHKRQISQRRLSFL